MCFELVCYCCCYGHVLWELAESEQSEIQISARTGWVLGRLKIQFLCRRTSLLLLRLSFTDSRSSLQNKTYNRPQPLWLRVTHPPCSGRLQSRTPLSNDHSFRKSFVALNKHCICQKAGSTWLQHRPENAAAAGSRSLCLGPRAVGWDSWHPWLTRTNPIPPEWDFAGVCHGEVSVRSGW